MSVSVRIQRIERATARSIAQSILSHSFDVVELLSDGGTAAIFLPAGTGQAVADAINAALAAEGQGAAA